MDVTFLKPLSQSDSFLTMGIQSGTTVFAQDSKSLPRFMSMTPAKTAYERHQSKQSCSTRPAFAIHIDAIQAQDVIARVHDNVQNDVAVTTGVCGTMKRMNLPMVGYEQIAQALVNGRDSSFEAADLAEPNSAISNAELIAQLSHVLATLEQAGGEPGVFASVDDRIASLVQSYLARQSYTKPEGIVLTDAGPEAKFDSKDLLGWAGSLFDWIKGLKKRKFVDQSSAPLAVKNKTRIALLSDWGTGMYGAPVCAESIEKDGDFDIVLHLGDVYYSGDIDEVNERFLKFWPRVPEALNRALNSNHEMYSGGYGYFDHILPTFNQASSYFALQNDHWLLIGLDTGYSEHELHGNQAKWLLDLVSDSGDRRVVLFSHHQPYSLYEKQGNTLVGQLSQLLEARRIYAWYWGHEHRCVVHDPHPRWGLRGRCVGHSGFPYFRDKFGTPLSEPGWQPVLGKNLVPGGFVLDGPNKYVADNSSKYGPNGYIVLELDDRDLRERFMNPDGSELPTPVKL